MTNIKWMWFEKINYLQTSVGAGLAQAVVSDYGPDDRAIGVRSPAGAEDFSSSLCVQTGSGAHPVSCTMGTGVLFSGGKARPGRDADHVGRHSVKNTAVHPRRF
jgi:hypothetical protein